MYIDRTSTKKKTPVLHRIIFITAGFLFSLIVTSLLVRVVIVQEESMSPSLNKGDVVFFFKPGSPEPGDIVFYKNPVQTDRSGISRVVAGPGSSVEIRDKTVLVDKQRSPVSYKHSDNRIFPEDFSYRDNMPVTTVKEEHLFIIGDNFDRSYDSRYFGQLHSGLIKGVMFFSF